MNRNSVLPQPQKWAQRGQLSIDVLFAIIALAIFFSVLVNTYNDRLTTQTREQSASNEARAILLDVYSAVGTVQAYGQNIDYVSPSLRQKNASNQLLPCAITVDKPAIRANGYINVGILGDTGKIDRNYLGIDLGSVSFTDPVTKAAVANFACGTKVSIGKVAP